MIADEVAWRTEVHAEGRLRLSGSVVTIGSFDAVHRGHQALLARVVGEARRLGVASVAYTFDVPPKAFFAQAVQLVPVEEKLRRLSHFALDHVVVAAFGRDYAARPAMAFVEELARMSPEAVWVGEDFRFGRAREGDVALLRRHFDVRVMDTVVSVDGARISSTRLRALLADGHGEQARRLHGWPDRGCLPGTVL